MTICMFASLATMIQPGQWIRYYAAKSAETLKRERGDIRDVASLLLSVWRHAGSAWSPRDLSPHNRKRRYDAPPSYRNAIRRV